MPSFVDKSSGMLKHLFHGEKMKLISAPRQFSKSTNLNMIKTFFSIPLNDGDATERLETFKRVKINAEYPDFVNSTFGTYPVLYLNFWHTDRLSSYEEAVKIITRKVHDSYREHSYLRSSMMLDDEDREICTRWYGVRSYHNMKPMEIQNGLRNLARYLYTHYNNTRVFLLIDDYDEIIIEAIFDERSYIHLKDIIDLFIGQILQLVKSNKHVERAVITSVYPIESSGHSGLNSIVNYRFLRNHPYVDFYGFTETEVQYLFTKLNVSKVLAKEAHTQWYGAYVSKQGHRIYNPFSILKFLGEGRIDVYWRTKRVNEILHPFRYPPIKEKITKMLRNESIKIEFCTDVSVNDICLLKEMKGCDCIEQSVNIEDIFFSFLFELGYVTFCGQEKQNHIRIPNLEMKDVFVTTLLRRCIHVT